jgi:hypothetical protein
MVNRDECCDLSPFLALCALASQERWCWNLICGTCGHSHFRYAFKELICGKHPDKEGWTVNKNTRITKQVFQTLPARGGFTEQEQETLTRIVLEATLEDIRAVSKFPDWLGYLGLVLTYCGSQKDHLSEVWAPQFLNMLPQTCHAYDTLLEINRGLRCISLNDLESIESAMTCCR